MLVAVFDATVSVFLYDPDFEHQLLWDYNTLRGIAEHCGQVWATIGLVSFSVNDDDA